MNNMNFKNRYRKKQFYLTSFLPLVVTNLLKKGEKEKTFVKVSKVLARLKKNVVLHDSFLINKRIFINKIFAFGEKNDVSYNGNFYFNFMNENKLRNFLNYYTKLRIFFYINNVYSNDFSRFANLNLKQQLHKKNLFFLKNKKIRITIYKSFYNLFFIFLKKNRKSERNSFSLIFQEILSKKKFSFFKLYQNYDLNVFLNRILKKKILFCYLFLIDLTKLNKYNSNKILFFNFFFKFNFFKNLNKIFLYDKFDLKGLKKKIFYFRPNFLLKKKKYYYLSKKVKLLKKQHKNLDLKYLNLKKRGKKMTRFEYKKRKILYKKLMKAYSKSRADFFKFKRKQNYKNRLKLKQKHIQIIKESYRNNFGLKLFVIKKEFKTNKFNLKKFFFKYSIFPVLFSPVKFLNIILSYYRLYFTFKEQRLWGKQQKIPTLLNLIRDIRITARNFKKSLKDDRFVGLRFEDVFLESLLLAGAKKGFLLKIKRQAYIFMIKNAIFLQFMIRRRLVSRRKRRKKINRV